MKGKLFRKFAAIIQNNKWNNIISRETPLYKRKYDIRSEFSRDYNRLLHATAYRRLKHKTQVFFATRNDHICTRMEHVNHVASVSYTIANRLGLNTELTSAIAIGHDLGHAPFGHEGEKQLGKLLNANVGDTFWHERNSLRFADLIETLPDPKGNHINLSLTYGVRDGIISHCGEINENNIVPRRDYINLQEIERPNQYPPYTWEGCIVKVADRISYLGRDIEDAILLRILSYSQIKRLSLFIREKSNVNIREMNNTVVMHQFIVDICKSSTPDKGICFSSESLDLMQWLYDFNKQHIYSHNRIEHYKQYVELIIQTLFDYLMGFFADGHTLSMVKKARRLYPTLGEAFVEWLVKYSNINLELRVKKRFANKLVYNLTDRNQYVRCVIDFISGMTDSFAIRCFQELVAF